MKVISIALAVIVFQQAPADRVKDAPTVPIRGVVTRVGTATPVPGARVVLSPPPGAPARSLPATTTDNDGKFVLAPVEPGDYIVQFTAPGYVGAPTKEVRVAAEDAVPAIAMELTPAAVVTGSVRDATGKPIPRAPVHMMRSAYRPNGKKSLEIFRQDFTNDLGEFRLFGIWPGRYYISAGGLPWRVDSRIPEEVNVNDIPVTYGRMFFPNTGDPGGAAALDLAPGETTPLDFTLVKSGRYRIRGRLVNMGAPGSNIKVSASVVTTIVGEQRPLTNDSPRDPYAVPASVNLADGAFEIPNLLPGTYRLNASSAGRDASILVTLPDADVEGVVLVLGPPSGQTLTGRVEAENGARGLIRSFDFWPIDGQDADGFVSTKEDGTFTKTLPAGSYSLKLPNNAAFYVKEVWVDDVKLSLHSLTSAEASAAALRIILSSGVARLSGMVRTMEAEPTAAVLVAVPDPQRDRADLYRSVQVDRTGRFELNIPPGNYKLFAWRTIESYSWLDPAVLGEYEGQDIAVHLDERSEVAIDLRVIPPASRP